MVVNMYRMTTVPATMLSVLIHSILMTALQGGCHISHVQQLQELELRTLKWLVQGLHS